MNAIQSYDERLKPLGTNTAFFGVDCDSAIA